MCDQDHFAEDLKKYTRRDVGTIAAAVGVAMMLPRAAHAVDVKESEVTITTPDGSCDAYFVAPTTGAHAAVLVWPDIFGLRPAIPRDGQAAGRGRLQRARRQSVLSADEGADGTAGRGDADPAARADDAGADADDARHGREGVRRVARRARRKSTRTGRSARPAIAWAARSSCARRQPYRIAIGAGGSFHGGGLTTMNPDSPHLLIPQMKAQFLIAVAENDDMRDPTSKTILKDAFAAAKLEGRDRGLPGRARLVPARHDGLRHGPVREGLGPHARDVQDGARVALGFRFASGGDRACGPRFCLHRAKESRRRD